MPRQARLDAPGTFHPVMIRGIEKGRLIQKQICQSAVKEVRVFGGGGSALFGGLLPRWSIDMKFLR